jgi:hypothetical protein
VRQHAIAALNLIQQAKQTALGDAIGTANAEPGANTALIDGLRKYAMDVRELDIDLIDRINPFSEAYAILAKAMTEDSLKQVAAAIAGKRTSPDAGGSQGTGRSGRQIQEGARALAFDQRDRMPGKSGWLKGAAAFVRFKDEGRYDGH